MSKILKVNNFNFIKLGLASPEKILSWSHGEVTKPETINYRTGRSERGGLFDERTFGPEKDYECYCGKYRRIRYKDIVCEKCGVEVTRSIVRRDRMGHIELASPISHIWFLRGVPSRMSILMGVPLSQLEKVIYFAGYIIITVDEKQKEQVIKDVEQEFKIKLKATNNDDDKEKLKELLLATKKQIAELSIGKVLSEAEYHSYSYKYSSIFEAGIGAEAIHDIFKKLDLPVIKKEIEEMLQSASAVEKVKLYKRLSLVKQMINSDTRPEWMFLKVIPVIPPALRPMVALDSGRHATSDINDLYRRVINRNNRLKKLKEIGAPDVILRNEKRILQEAVDSLLDNSICQQSDSAAMSQSQRRPLKSLADNLKSKQGLFRQNLLGKRVDYSGRSVIVVGPQLQLHQCGLPKHMALELFRPFVISKLISRELAYNIRGANRLIEDRISEVWEILEEVIQGKYVLLNRAPTLHRLGIQAFQPTLIEGNAIQVHPLVCEAYNADFDGDQMAVHVPLSEEAQAEARDLMAANKNLLKPQTGEPIIKPKQDIVLGCFWMTKMVDGDKGEGTIHASPNHAIMAYDYDQVSFRAKIKVRPSDKKKYDIFNGEIFETTVGRLLFNSVLPESFEFINETMGSKRLSALVNELIVKEGIDGTPEILDKIKNFGTNYSTKSGITWGMDNVMVPSEKKDIVKEGKVKEAVILEQWQEGLLSDEEKYKKTIELWEDVKDKIEKVMPDQLDKNGSAYDIIMSGARGTVGNLTQMAGMKGMIQNTQGRIIDFPIIPSFKEGLSPLEYFITTHGSRKGLADTALNTAKAGYLTRRLVDVAQDVVVTEEDCGTKHGKTMTSEKISGITIPLSRNIVGRITHADVKDKEGKVLFKKGHLIIKEDAKAIEEAGVKEVFIRSPLTCETIHGICQKCYGLDLGRNRIVKEGEAVGIIAAQAIGEPGTQLTLRTFHLGGVAGTDITQGLPRVEEIFERRTPKTPAIIAKHDGVVLDIREIEGKNTIVVDSEKKGAKEEYYVIPPIRIPTVKIGDQFKAGDLLTDGSANMQEILKYGGKEKAQEYIIYEINKIYELQGASTSRKHIEIIVRQMFSRRRILDPGNTKFSTGETIENTEFMIENNEVGESGGGPAKADTIVLGITEVSITTKSWLSAASFQNTNRVLINNAVKGGVDRLRGLKENVIIGHLIPAGTGYKSSTPPAEEEEIETKE